MSEIITPADRTRAMIAAVAALHGTTYREVVGSCRRANVVRARYEAIRLVARVKPHLSMPQLGRAFRRDHSSVLYALGRLTARRPSARVDLMTLEAAE